MSMPFYVSPEQLVKDRADFARKGIARGRSVVVFSCSPGVLFVADNPSRSLHKTSEIYDRIGFAAVGKYNEFENLRVAGVQYADLRGYSYARTDVTARALATAYSQSLGTMFTQGPKPFEVEIVVAEVGQAPQGDELYRLTFDGGVGDEPGFIAMGGSSDTVAAGMRARWRPGLSLAAAMQLAQQVLRPDAGAPTESGSGRNATGQGSKDLQTAAPPPRSQSPHASAAPGGEPGAGLEVALLDREASGRTFRRLSDAQVAQLLSQTP